MSEDTFREPASVEAHPDMLTLDQLEQIKKDISTNQPMVGPIEPIAELLELYKESQSPGFVPGIHFLSGVFSGMRRIRGDGNCFYRGLLFGYLESVLRIAKSGNETDLADAKLEIERISRIIRGSMADLVAVGYSEFTIEVFYDVCCCESCFINSNHFSDNYAGDDGIAGYSVGSNSRFAVRDVSRRGESGLRDVVHACSHSR